MVLKVLRSSGAAKAEQQIHLVNGIEHCGPYEGVIGKVVG